MMSLKGLDDWIQREPINNSPPCCEECEEYDCGLSGKYKTCEPYLKAIRERAEAEREMEKRLGIGETE